MKTKMKMKSVSDAKERIISKSFVSIFIKNIQEFAIFVRMNALLPSFFYSIVMVVLFLQTTATFLLVNKIGLWDMTTPATKVIKYLSFIWRFGSNVEKELTSNIIFGILVGFSIVGYSIDMILFISFMKHKNLPKRWCWISSLNIEFFLPLVNMAIPPEIAKLFHLREQYLQSIEDSMNSNNSGLSSIGTNSLSNGLARDIVLVIEIGVLMILFLYYAITTILKGSPALFEPGRSQFWAINYNQNHVIILVSLIAFLSRILEFVNGYAYHILCCVSLLILILLLFFENYYLPLIYKYNQAIHSAFLVSTIIALTIQTHQDIVPYFSDTIFILAYFTIGGVLSFIFYYILNNYEEKVVLLLNRYDEKQITFEECFHSSTSFIKMIEIGFKYGHPAILSWAPFIEAFEVYNNAESVWILYIWLLTVYYEENSKLAVAINQFKMMKYHKSFSARCFLAHIKTVERSRTRHMSKDIRSTIKIIDLSVNKSRNLLISYWNAISENSLYAAYNFGCKLKESLEFCQSSYAQLISFFPNNPTISLKYAKFLDTVVNDPQSALHWYHRSDYLSKSKTYIVDMPQTHAQKLFPMLPNSIFSFANESEEEESISLQSREGDSSNSGSETGLEIHENDSNSVQSLYRKYGENLPNRNIQILMILTFIIFFVAFLCGQFLIPIIMQNGSHSFNGYYNGIILLGNLCYRLEVIGFCFLRTALYAGGLVYDNLEKEDTALGVEQFFNQTQDILLTLLEETNNGIEQLTSRFITFSKHYFIQTLQKEIRMVSPQIVNGVMHQNNYTSYLQEAVNGINFIMNKYDKNDHHNFLNETWVINYLLNVDAVSDALNLSSTKLRNDMNDILNNSYHISFVISIVIGCMTVLLLPIFIIYSFKIKEDWKFIVKAISSLPKIALRKAINKNSMILKHNEENYSKEESKFINQFLQMQATGDAHDGLSIQTMIITFIISIFIAIGAMIFSLNRVYERIPLMTTYPNRYLLLSQYIASIFTCGNYIQRATIVEGEHSFWSDTYENLTESYNYFFEIHKKKNNQLISDEWNNYPSGILSVTKKISDYLLKNSEDWQEHEFLHDRFINVAPIVQMETLHSHLEGAYENFGMNFHSSSNLEFFSHSLILHLYPDNLISLAQIIAESFAQTLNSIVDQSYLIAAGLFFIGMIITGFQYQNLKKVLDTIRFCVSLLSIVDSVYIENANAIMNIFGGVFHGSLASASEKAMKDMCKDLIPEAVMIVDEKYRVLYANNSMKLKYGYAMGSILKDDISSHLIEFQNGEEFKFGEKEAIQIFHSENNEILIMIHEEKPINFTLKKTENILSTVNEIKCEIVPKELHRKMNFISKNIVLHSNNIVILALEMLGFSSYVAEKGNDLISFYKAYDKKLHSIAGSCNDAAIVKQFGMTHFVCFNIDRQITNTYDIGEDIVHFLCAVHQHAKEENLKIRYAMIYTRFIQSGLRKFDGKFHVFSNRMNRAHILCMRSSPGFLLLPSEALEILPSYVSKVATEVEIMLKQMTTHWINSIDLELIDAGKVK
ncbi:hypothetical protein TRFO_25090 [Tritrichomonas foetus]|uniref:TmcB/TmcC TPR repeats domain-containing protein n=1 Tax=Tritrichomonas foetus TaxID=1144522 RepID=A0A1J4K7H8_9EUKA|nr:hypothetical protein TRFO_25090 [Tritrichomonas foetus]|eukprot:OHT06840.1 hypothetical protein TRFO_25090 [Tritrichomonas foetus]